MTVRTLLWSLLFAALAAAPSGRLEARSTAAPYKGAIAVDAATGDVLFADNADEISPPASMTKLMTFAVMDDSIRAGRLSRSTRLTATAADAKVGAMRDSTSVWLKNGEAFTVDELTYAMMLQSANDAAYLVAHTVAGSIPAFVDLMNAKARELGMTRTTFRSPNGLPPPDHRISDGDLTTPRDYSRLCRYLVTHTDILRYTSVKRREFGVGVRFPPTLMINHNHLLGKVAGVDGLKTGFTNGAGFCLSATAQRGGRRVIVVVMDCPDARDRDLAADHMIERAFAVPPRLVLPALTPVTPGQPAAPAAATPASNSPPPIRFTVPGSNT